MKAIAIIGNVAYMGWLVVETWLAAGEMWMTGAMWLNVLLLAALLIVNIIALMREESQGWLGLYFKRKRLEEEKKIEALEKGGEK